MVSIVWKKWLLLEPEYIRHRDWGCDLGHWFYFYLHQWLISWVNPIKLDITDIIWNVAANAKRTGMDLFFVSLSQTAKRENYTYTFSSKKNKEAKKLWSSVRSYWDLGISSKYKSQRTTVLDCLHAKKVYSMSVSLWHRARDEWGWKGAQGVIWIHFSMFPSGYSVGHETILGPYSTLENC